MMTTRQKLLCSLSLLVGLWSSGLMAGPQFMQGWNALVEGDYRTAHKIWLPLADQGSRQAQNNLALMYLRGQGVRRDDKKAVYWLNKAVNLGSLSAQTTLAVLYLEGREVVRDSNVAFELFYIAAREGYPPAQFNLGRMYSEGIAVSQDYKKSIKWFRRAAEQGHSEARSIVTELLSKGRLSPPQTHRRVALS